MIMYPAYNIRMLGVLIQQLANVILFLYVQHHQIMTLRQTHAEIVQMAWLLLRMQLLQQIPHININLCAKMEKLQPLWVFKTVHVILATLLTQPQVGELPKSLRNVILLFRLLHISQVL